MGANFTPTFGEYSPLTPFRYWCQKVLPLVYDDSLSYYELLNKVVDYLNKTMEDVETLNGDTGAMLAAFNQLQTYVNTYFDELDLTEEVQAVLDRMAENGSLDELLRPLVGEQIGGVVAEQIDDAVADQIYATVAEQIETAVASALEDNTIVQGAVEDWLNTHVATGDIIVDDTLTISGAAADAKVTGKYINGIEQDISSNFNFTDSRSIRVTDGKFLSGSENNRANQNFVNIEGFDEITFTARTVASATTTGGAFYSSNSESSFLTGITTKTSQDGVEVVTLKVPENAKYIRLTYWTVAKLTSENWDNFRFQVKYEGLKEKTSNVEERLEILENKTPDKTLTIEGDSADAKATGDIIKEVEDKFDEKIDGVDDDITSMFRFGANATGINALNGTIISATNLHSNDDITENSNSAVDISNYKQLVITMPISSSTGNWGLAFYSGKNTGSYISGVRHITGNNDVETITVNVPDGAKYVRTTYWNDDTIAEYSYPAFNCHGIVKGIVEKIDDNTTRIEDIEESLDSIKGRNIKDDLMHGSGKNILIEHGTYGSNDAVYKINADTSPIRCTVDFKITRNLNVGDDSENLIFASFIGNNTKTASMRKQKPDTEMLLPEFNGGNDTYYQAPCYRSGFIFNDRTALRNGRTTNPLVGSQVFSIWLKGSYSDTEAESSELSARDTWLSNYQDIAIVCDNDTISMIRDGIDANGNQFNDGSTSTLWSVSMKTGDNYKALGTLYQDIESAINNYSGIEGFSCAVRFYDLSSRKNAGDILQFGKVKLIGYYKQQINPETETQTKLTSYHYDSYPCYFNYSLEEVWHTLDVVQQNNKLWMAIDGQTFTTNYSGNVREILLGGITENNGVIFKNLEVFLDGTIGDCEAFTVQSGQNELAYLISDRTPRAIPLMGHDMITSWEGSGVIPSGNQQQQTVTHVEDIIKYALEKGYEIISLDEFHDMYVGRKKMPKRVTFFILDDARVAEAYTDLRNRAFVSKYGACLNFATIDKTYTRPADIENNFKLFTSMRGNGWCCCSHSYRHDVRFAEKNSIIFFWELNKIKEDADNLNWLNDVLVANGTGGTVNQYLSVEAAGYAMMFHNDLHVASKYINSYRIGRTNIGDNTSSGSAFGQLV